MNFGGEEDMYQVIQKALGKDIDHQVVKAIRKTSTDMFTQI